jgi:hydrogenase maturation protease
LNGLPKAKGGDRGVPGMLVFGIGNSGRSDDGLGWAFLDRIGKDRAFYGQAEYRYQLQVEDAALASTAERVVFVDASRNELEAGYRWTPCAPLTDFQFTTHTLPPGAVMYYCKTLFDRQPTAHLLEIQGFRWELQIGLSRQAEANLERALEFFREKVLDV